MKILHGLFSSYEKAADSIKHPFMALAAFLSVVLVVLLAFFFMFGLTEGYIHPGWLLVLGVGVIIVLVILAAALYYNEEQNRHKEKQLSHAEERNRDKEQKLDYAERTVAQLKQVVRDVVMDLQQEKAGIQIVYVEHNPPGDDVLGEFVSIENFSGIATVMANWILSDEAGHRFTFPALTLKPGTRVRVWTKAGTNTMTNLYWDRDLAVWNNRGDRVFLLDDAGELVHSYRY
jgi:hypothetical protein